MKHFKIGVTDPAGRGGVGIMLSAVNWGGDSRKESPGRSTSGRYAPPPECTLLTSCPRYNNVQIDVPLGKTFHILLEMLFYCKQFKIEFLLPHLDSTIVHLS